MKLVGLFCALLAVSTAGADVSVDSIVVEKGRRTMHLYSGNTIVRSYTIALGPNPVGRKEKDGDGRTPEGRYRIESRNENSAYHRALRLSYPNAEDRHAAETRGVPPGGDIMIHGLPNGIAAVGEGEDWTRGCIAVENAAIEEIWRLVHDGTPIEIRP